MQHLSKILPQIGKSLKSARQILLFLDYDGTLTPIVRRPEYAVLSDDTRRLLVDLAAKEGLILGVISGRKLSAIKELVRIPDIYYAGNHGWEISFPNGFIYTNPQAAAVRPVLQKITAQLQDKLKDIAGVLIEDKDITLSIHYRTVKAHDREKLKETVQTICLPYQEQNLIRINFGKMVIEILPPMDWNKGNAILLLRELIAKDVSNCIIYLGDDQTDENAFRAMDKLDISVFVGKTRRSAARFYLNNIDEVIEFLKQIKEGVWGS